MIDMNAVRQALQRRAAGGGGAPAATQVSNPQGRPTPLPNPPSIPGAPAPSSMPNTGRMAPQGAANPAQQVAKQAAVAQGPAFDEETKKISKALIQKLIGVM